MKLSIFCTNRIETERKIVAVLVDLRFSFRTSKKKKGIGQLPNPFYDFFAVLLVAYFRVYEAS